MDVLNLRIAKLLAEDGRISYREIARQLSISEPTARSRVNEMLKTGKVSVKACVNIDLFPDILVAYIGLKLTGSIKECLDMLSKIPEVVYTVSTIGRYDIIAVVAVSSRVRLADILTNEIFGKNNKYITFSETHMVLYNRNLLIPAENVMNMLLNSL